MASHSESYADATAPPAMPEVVVVDEPPDTPTPPPTRLYPGVDESLVQSDPEFRLTVLRNFACPFRAESTCRFEDSPGDCIFGHPETSPIGRLLDIPEYACIYYLLERCKNPRKVKQITSGPGGGQKVVLHGCTSAIHLDPMVLIDLDHFEAQYAAVISEYFNDSASDDTRGTIRRDPRVAPANKSQEGDEALQCGICYDRIRAKYLKTNRLFALLEKCDHCFCGPCILEYRAASSQNMSCPICRIVSKRFLLSDRFYKSDSVEKRRLFEAYRCQCNS